METMTKALRPFGLFRALAAAAAGAGAETRGAPLAVRAEITPSDVASAG